MRMTRFEAIATLIKKHSCQYVAEIGVETGLILQNILKDPEVKKLLKVYYLIDFWRRHPPAGPQSEEQWDEWARQVYQLFWNEERAKIVRLTSVQAATLFKKESLDMVYIDANHKEPFVRADIKAWYPIVKKGGVLSGHDWHLERVRKPVYEAFGEKRVQIFDPPKGRIEGSWFIQK